MSGIAGIDAGINTFVLIPKIDIAMRYQKVSIPEPGIEIRYRKLSIPGRGIEIGYRKVSIPGRGIEIGYQKVSISKLVFDTSFFSSENSFLTILIDFDF